LHGLSVVTAVSEEIRQQTHITSRATTALANQKIKIETLMQGQARSHCFLSCFKKTKKRQFGRFIMSSFKSKELVFF
jgi:aspartokinase